MTGFNRVKTGFSSHPTL